MTENRYQAGLIKRICARWPGCQVLKNDPNHRQGIPDLTILFEDKWAVLEVKASRSAPFQPNQEHYIHRMDTMSFAAMICPENEEEVLNALERTFEPRNQARVPKSK